ncbi:MAG: TatD family hydrolase [Chloroflexi bacterium]|nr:TatD family hydrolase [Chloroflexota bacterium]
MIDTHIHLNFDAYDEDRDAVVARAAAVGVTRCINPGVNVDTSRTAVSLAARYPGAVYAAVGYHPNDTAGFETSRLDPIRELASSSGVVSIGEIGLDYYWNKSPKDDQIAAFEAQLELAAELGLPVIIHNRESSEDVVRILEAWAGSLGGVLRDAPGVLHSVSAPPELVERALAAGFYIGFTGPITYKNADQTRRIAADAPLDRILVETDGPFLTPVPHRGERNEPAYIPLIIERLASVKQMTPAQIAEATTANAERLFRFS